VTLALLLACTGAPGDSGTGDGGTDTAADAGGPVALTDASNYRYTIDLQIGEAPIAISDVATIDWSGFTEDLQGFEVDPGNDITTVSLVWFRDLTPEEVEEAVISGGITQSSVGLYATRMPEPGRTGIALAQLDLYGTPFKAEEYMIVEGGAWLVRLATARNPEAMAFFVTPTADGPGVVSIGNDSSVLAFDPDLAALSPVKLNADMTVDWTALTRDGRGAALDPLTLQELWIARYDGYDRAALEERFFELELLPTDTWRASAYGEDGLALGDAVNEAGEAFTGATPDATWLMALRCLLCASPAPVYLTALDPG